MVIARALALPLLSGILYWLGSQAFALPQLVWVCLVPLGIALHRTTPGRGLAGGLLYGFCFWVFAVWWIRIPLVTLVHLPPSLAWGVTLVFCALQGLPYGVFGFLAGTSRLFESWWGACLAAASLVVIRTCYPYVFPGSEAHNLYACPRLIQVLDLGGAPLLLFFVYFVNFQLVRALAARGDRGSQTRALASAAAALALLAGYGELRLRTLHLQMGAASPGEQITVLAIQPDVPVGPDAADVPPEDVGNDVATALAMSRDAIGRSPGVELVAWPEIPLVYHCGMEAGRDLPPLAKDTGKAFILPCSSMIGDRGEAFYNSVTFIDATGVVGEEYRKLILLPFGEYLPMEGRFPFLRKIFPGVMPFVPGDHGAVLYDFGPGRRLIPALCYESIFTGHVRRFVEGGGTVLVNMVDDAWFGTSPGSAVHLSLALFRTVEFRIPLVRVANSGIGCFVQPTGEIVPGSRTPLFRRATTAHTLYIPPQRSPYRRWGDALLYGLAALVVLGWVSRLRRR